AAPRSPIDAITLRTVDGNPPVSARPLDVKVRTNSDTTLVVAASTHRPYRLVSGQAMSQQWTADRGSTDLGSATELDTQAGWTVGTGTTAVTVHYAPQTSYRVAVVLSTLALAAAALVVVLDPGSRRRRRLPRSDVNRRVWLALFDAAVVVFAFGI